MLQASCGSDVSHCSFAQNLIRTSLAVTSVRPLCRFSLLAKFTFQGLGFIISALKKLIIHKLCSDVTPWVTGLSSHSLKVCTNIFHKACSKGISVSVLACVCMQESGFDSRWRDVRRMCFCESTAAAFPWELLSAQAQETVILFIFLQAASMCS